MSISRMDVTPLLKKVGTAAPASSGTRSVEATANESSESAAVEFKEAPALKASEAMRELVNREPMQFNQTVSQPAVSRQATQKAYAGLV
jgi:hypothetical protein